MNKVYVYIVQAMQIAYDIFGTLLLAVFLGVMIDKYLHTQPIGILVGALLGIISCFKSMLKIGGE